MHLRLVVQVVQVVDVAVVVVSASVPDFVPIDVDTADLAYAVQQYSSQNLVHDLLADQQKARFAWASDPWQIHQESGRLAFVGLVQAAVAVTL